MSCSRSAALLAPGVGVEQLSRRSRADRRSLTGEAMRTTETGTSKAAVGDGRIPAIIRTAELTKVYVGSDVAAVDKLDLSVAAGEIFGLLGPNGAGKTTTAGMLTTRVIPTAGSAHVGSVDVIAHPALGEATHRGCVADEHARSAADGVGEPVLPWPAIWNLGGGVAPRRRRAAPGVKDVAPGGTGLPPPHSPESRNAGPLDRAPRGGRRGRLAGGDLRDWARAPGGDLLRLFVRYGRWARGGRWSRGGGQVARSAARG